jgi:hypothetical protein
MNCALLMAMSAATLIPASGPPPIQSQTIGLIQHRGDYVASLERFFDTVDAKAPGYFAAADRTLPGYHIDYPPVPYPQAQLEAPFRCVDANRDGRISRQEYVDYGARAFDATVRNGYLDHAAFAHAISPNGGCK